MLILEGDVAAIAGRDAIVKDVSDGLVTLAYIDREFDNPDRLLRLTLEDTIRTFANVRSSNLKTKQVELLIKRAREWIDNNGK